MPDPSRPPRRRRSGGGVAAAPAVASEPNVPSGPPPPAVLVVPNLAPLPHPSTRAKRPSIRRVRVVPRRIRRSKRARLRLTLSAPARLKIVVQRRVRGHRIRVRTLNVDARPAASRSVADHLAQLRGGGGRAGRPTRSRCLLDLAAARQLRPHDRSDPRHLAQHPAQLREPGDTPTEIGYAVAELVQLVDQRGLNAGRTLVLALDRRDRAIEDIRVLARPLRVRKTSRACVPARARRRTRSSRSTR